jgi:hypothetical protein
MIFLGMVGALAVLFALVWFLWMQETHPDKKTKPLDSDSLKSSNQWNERIP